MDPIPDRDALEASAGGRFGPVHVFDEVDSTNAWLLAEALSGAPDGTVAVADHQFAGRGRLGRTWSAPAGSALLCSVLLRPGSSGVEASPAVTLLAGLAMADAVETVAPSAGVALKWPNDLRTAGRKLGGVLTEASSHGTGGASVVEAVVIGCGVNILRAALPAEVAPIAVSLEELGAGVERADLLAAYLRALDAVLAAPLSASIDRYRERCETIGREVRAERADDPVVGTAVSVDGSGALVVRTAAGADVPISTGEITHLR